jgi:hypothetical protein
MQKHTEPQRHLHAKWLVYHFKVWHDEAMSTRTPDFVEGTEAWSRFNAGMKTIMSVSKIELQRREAEYKKQADANPNKRGPKPKTAKQAS